MTAERVILVDERGNHIGSADKSTVHSSRTPLHLAFSCYLLDDRGRLLVTRRALEKKTWPGVWTNSFCGHPAPGELLENAVIRRAQQELGTVPQQVRSALPEYRYRATDASGIVENELCPVFVARFGGSLSPDPREIAEWHWADPLTLARSVAQTPFAFSPWLADQLPLLIRRGSFERVLSS